MFNNPSSNIFQILLIMMSNGQSFDFTKKIFWRIYMVYEYGYISITKDYFQKYLTEICCYSNV